MTIETQARPVPRTTTEREWWRGAVIYQIYPRSFADSNDDGVGDLRGIASRLDYVRSLGVDAIWLSPFYKSPMRDFGYDVADYCDVDPVFGTLADFDALIARGQALGLKVIIDQVFSHTSDRHRWFEESKKDRENSKADWYVWADPKPDGSAPNNWLSVFKGPAWTWSAKRGQYYLHNFLPEQPALNVHNAAVQDALLDVARFWFDRGVDGFRLDAVNFMMCDLSLRDNPPAAPERRKARPFDFQSHIYNQSHADIPNFLARLRTLADSYGDKFLVAEVGGENAVAEMKLYTAPPQRLHSAYGFQFLVKDRLDAKLVTEVAGAWRSDGSEGWPAWAFSNHDAPRAVSRWANGRDGDGVAKLTFYLLACLRGSIFLYQGEELGLPQAQVPFERLRDPETIANWPLPLAGRDGARTPMPWLGRAPNGGFSSVEPWLPVDPAHCRLSVDAQEEDPDAPLHVARRAIALRREYPALRTDAMTFYDAPAPLLVFQRGEGERSVLCVFNLGDEHVAWRLPDGWRIGESLNGAEEGVSPPLSVLLAVKS